MEFLVTKGKLIVKNNEPLIVLEGKEKAMSKSEFILWTSLNWKILNKESLKKEFERYLMQGVTMTMFSFLMAQNLPHSS